MKIGYRHIGKYKGTEAIQNSIDITQQGIDLAVKKDDVIADLNLAVKDGKGVVELKGNTVVIESDNFKLTEDGRTEQTSGKIANFEINKSELSFEIIPKKTYTQDDLNKVWNYISTKSPLTPEEYEMYDLNQDGKVTTQDYVAIENLIRYHITPSTPGKFKIQSNVKGKSIVYSNIGYFSGNDELITGFSYNTMKVKGIDVNTTNDSYSIDEIETGKKWIDGKEIYRKVITGNLPSSPATWGDIAYLGTGVSIKIINGTMNGYLPVPCYISSNYYSAIQYNSITGSIQGIQNGYANANLELIIEYTK